MFGLGKTFVAMGASCLLFVPQIGFAQCVASGSAVTCTGTDTNGFEDDSDGLTITIQQNALVTDNSDALKVEGDGVRIINNGTIDGAGDDAIQSSNHLSVTNTGTITAQDEGINADDDPSLTNAVIFNSGTISARDNDAVKVGDFALVVNSGLIENLGADPSDTQDAIDLNSGAVVNEQGGVIRSPLDAAIDFDEGDGTGYVSNSGIIQGQIGILTDEDNTGPQHVVNRGLIEGISGVSLQLGAGADQVDLRVGGTFLGEVNLGQGPDLFTVGAGYHGDLTGDFTINGGGGRRDTLDLSAIGFNAVETVTEGATDVYDIVMKAPLSDVGLRVTAIELFKFGVITITLQDLLDANPRR